MVRARDNKRYPQRGLMSPVLGSGRAGGLRGALQLVLGLVLTLLSGASATTPTLPWEMAASMDGTPIVGHAFAITLTAKLNAETDVTWSPAFPDWVDGDPSSWRMQGGAG